jgi:hypothetical protein
MTIINAKLNLDKIQKEKIFKGEKGNYYDVTITIFDKPDQYGNNVSICDSQTKEQREAKEPRNYLGNGKTVELTKKNTPPQEDEIPEWMRK